MQAARIARDIALAQRGHLIGWVPVCLGAGIGIYFVLREEPTAAFMVGLGIAAIGLAIAGRWVGYAWRPLITAMVLICAGLGAAKVRTELVAAPVLDFRYYGPIEGRIVGIDRSGSDALRLTLDRVRLDRVAPDRMPGQVRVSLHGPVPDRPFLPGERVMMTGHLSPPSGPAEPGGYDFRRHAWFAGLGAVGYTRTPTLRAAPADPGDLRTAVFKARMAVSRGVQQALPGETGAFAAAILSGDRSGIGQDVLDDLRAANLAHLLAISGLHMGLLTGVVFAALRVGLILLPGIGPRLPAKKIAAAGALVAAAGYLALSGGNVATERAFVMVAVMLVAIMLGRRALTLRAVAIAAVIVLVLQPEALAGPGFQMSFAATVALVAVFHALRDVTRDRVPRWARGGLAVVMSSLVAGLATAPFAAAHFNQISHFGLIANLVSVPLMGALIMPAAVLAACLAPLGLAWVGLMVMGWGLRWILWVAETVAGWDGAVSHVHSPGPWALPAFAVGALLVILWQGRARAWGVPVMACALVMWTQATRPPVLIAESGGLIGVMTTEGRALSRGSGDGFVAGVWLENDGAPVLQEVAGSRPGIDRDGRVFRAQLGSWTIVQVAGKTALAELAGCGGADILVSNQWDIGPRPCLVLDATALRGTGAVALSLSDAGGLRLHLAMSSSGDRPWTYPADTPAEQRLPVLLPVQDAPPRIARATGTAQISE